jgi:hypothetical protein
MRAAKTPREQVDRWLAEVGSHLGAVLALNRDGVCGLQFGDDELVLIEVAEGAPLVLVNAPIMPLPEEPAARYPIYEFALQCNLLRAGTGGGAIAMDPAGGLLALCYAEPIDRLDAEGLGALIQHAVATLTAIRQDFADAGFAIDSATSPMSTARSGGGGREKE